MCKSNKKPSTTKNSTANIRGAKTAAMYSKLFKITDNMLLDMISEREVLHTPPQKMPPFFRWASSHHWIGIQSIPINEILFVCRETAGKQLHEQFPKAFMLLLVKEAIPDWVYKSPDCAIVIKADEDENLLQQIQNKFLQIQNWDNMLEHTAYSSGDVQQLLTLCENFFSRPIMVYNDKCQCLARSMRQASADIKQNEKRIVLDSIENKNVVFTYKSPYDPKFSCEVLCKTTQTRSNPTKNCSSIFIMPSCDNAITLGTIDLFNNMLRYFDVKYDRLSISTHSFKDHNHEVFENLIKNKYISNAVLERFKLSLKIADKSEYRIMAFDTANLKSFQLEQLRSSVQKINHSQVLAIEYQGNILALAHSHEGDNTLSTKKLIKSIKKLYRNNPEIEYMNIAISQVFDNLPDIYYAYQQTHLCFEYIPFIDFEDKSLAYDGLKRICYPFEEVFAYLLINSSGIERRLFDFSLKHSLLEKLLKEDMEKGTQDIRILATFLFNERKATIVAEKLHMHRNSVLYHIEKIQERFDIDLSNARLREMLMLNIKLFFTRLPQALLPKDNE